MRKTLPDADGADLDNSFFPALPFYATDTTIDGQKFTAIYLSNPVFDSLAFNIVQAYEPFAESVITMARQQQVKGVMIDFRQDKLQQVQSTSFTVTNNIADDIINKNKNEINIRFAWDAASSSRAAGFINLLSRSSHLSAIEISSGSSFSSTNQDCFTSPRRGFDD